jgi:hypothetical protein
VVKRQRELWEEGLRTGRLFVMQKQRELSEGIRAQSPSEEGENDENWEPSGSFDEYGNGYLHEDSVGYGPSYGGGKWGKYLRAPDLYFRIMKEHGPRLVPLGEITLIRRGITSGCDDFFMPRDVTAEHLEKFSKLDWHDAPFYSACKRSEVESGRVKLIEAGDSTVHPLEAKFLAPEVHSLMNVSRPTLKAGELDRLILLVSEPIAKLKGTYVAKYLRYGEKNTFESKKSKAVPVPQRSTCVARDPWYDLTFTKRGHLIWPKSQQYRHVVVHNQNRLIVNCNLYDITLLDEKTCPPNLLAAVLNSTLVAMMKTYFGRYAGTEGNLKTEVVDVNLLEVPDPRSATPKVTAKLKNAFDRLCQRDTSGMVEEEFMECHTPERAEELAEKPIGLPWELQQRDRRDLDLAVFELLGVKSAAEREKLCDELYHEVATHFRQIRIVEIQKQEQRRKTANREFRIDELAADLWDALSPEEKEPLAAWLASAVHVGTPTAIPEGTPSLPDASDLFAANHVYFRQGKGSHANLTLPSRPHAELVHLLASKGLHGTLPLPDFESDAVSLLARVNDRLSAFAAKANQLARSRTSDDKRIDDLVALLQHWMLHGRPEHKATAVPKATVSRTTSGTTPLVI